MSDDNRYCNTCTFANFYWKDGDELTCTLHDRKTDPSQVCACWSDNPRERLMVEAVKKLAISKQPAMLGVVLAGAAIVAAAACAARVYGVW